MPAKRATFTETPPALAERYVLDECLGHGGQGETWLARRLADDEEVVIKIMDLSRLEDWKALELFEREARALAGLSLPGVPALHEHFNDAERFYLVQERIPGESLQSLLDAGYRFDEREAIGIALSLLEILEALHARRPPIIHRDIKPANIIRRPDRTCALVDFGAVTDAVRRDASESGETIAGTFGYMPPEQFHGQATAASDLYALGATLVHLLAAKPPAAMESQVFRLNFRPHVEASPALLAVLDRLLEPDVEARLADTNAVRGALREAHARPRRAPRHDKDERALPAPVARDLESLKGVGQPGSMTLFHATPDAPREISKRYKNALAINVALWFGGVGVVSIAAALGLLAVFKLGYEALIFAVLIPAFFAFDSVRRTRRTLALLGHGEKAEGEVVALRKTSDGETVIRYRFAVGSDSHTSAFTAKGDVWLDKGDVVGVLFDPDTPDISMIYPVPPRLITAVGDDD